MAEYSICPTPRLEKCPITCRSLLESKNTSPLPDATIQSLPKQSPRIGEGKEAWWRILPSSGFSSKTPSPAAITQSLLPLAEKIKLWLLFGRANALFREVETKSKMSIESPPTSTLVYNSFLVPGRTLTQCGALPLDVSAVV